LFSQPAMGFLWYAYRHGIVSCSKLQNKRKSEPTSENSYSMKAASRPLFGQTKTG
jgi:hypothetical protein